MTDEELNGYLVLIIFYVKQKMVALKKIYKILREIFKKKATYGTELRIGDKKSYFN